MVEASVALPLAVLVAGLVVLLVGESRLHRTLMLVGKLAAGAGFVSLAALGGVDRLYDRLILAGLAVSLIGDVFLVPADPRAFRGAIAGFLVAQVLYTTAFVVLGVTWMWVLGAAAVLVLSAALILPWILPRVPRPLKAAVVAYVVAISAMVATGTGAWQNGLWIGAAAGALSFYFADLTVAIHRFVEMRFRWRAIGLPFYYAAQALFALSVGR